MNLIRHIKAKSIFLLWLIYAFININQAMAQKSTTWTLAVTGMVKDKTAGGGMEGATITVMNGGTVVQTITVGNRGKFAVNVPPNGNYTVVFSKPGYVSKRIAINTSNVPAEDAKYGFQFPMEMSLFKSVKGMDFSVLNQPIAKINYNPNTGYFDYDKAYTKQVQSKVAKLMAEYDAKMKALEAKNKALQQQYETAMNAGDDALKSQNYQEAKTQYAKAASLKPDDKDAKDKLTQAEDLLQKQQAQNSQYLAAISAADAAFKAKNYDEATKNYNAALKIKPDEKYPQTQLAAIATALKSKADLDKKYQSLISDADGFFKKNQLDQAKTNYQAALKLKPNEKYPQQQLQQIATMIAEANKKNQQYQSLISQADSSFKKSAWQDAVSSYQQALKIKPNEQYPQNQIAIAQKNIANAAQLKKQYNQLIAAADQSFKNKQYGQAKTGYQKALALMANETYPQQQLKKIADLQVAKSKQEQAYQADIVKGDNAFKSAQWQQALQSYNGALGIKPGDSYSTQRIKTIQDTINAQKKQSAQYNQLIASADKSFKAKNYTDAQNSYQEALQIFPDKQYPKDQLSKISTQLSALKDEETKYQNFITQGDNAYEQKKYKDAEGFYNNALGIKPDEKYPKDQLVAIKNKLEALSQKDSLANSVADKQKAYYLALIQKADNAFNANNYDLALQSYQQSLIVIPGKKYPQDQIAKIKKLMASKQKQKDAQKVIDDKYNSLIAVADKAFSMKDYDDAVKNYKAALRVKSGEKYPTNQLSIINAILAKQAVAKNKEKATEDKYKGLIAKADMEFSTKDYAEAITNYKGALGIKPAEMYPKNQLAKIQLLLKKQKEAKQAAVAQKEMQDTLQNKYNAAIKEGDKAFASKSYELATNSYNDALGIFPKKEYPAAQISKIKKIEAELAAKKKKANNLSEKDKKYQLYVNLGDRAFNVKAYDNATKNYQNALKIKPDEQYPKSRLDTIQTILAENNKPKKTKTEETEKKATVNGSVEAQLDKKYAAIRANNAKSKDEFYEHEVKKVQDQNNLMAKVHQAQMKDNQKKFADRVKQINENHKRLEDNHQTEMKILNKKDQDYINAIQQSASQQKQQIADNYGKTVTQAEKQITAMDKKGKAHQHDVYVAEQQFEKHVSEQQSENNKKYLENRKKSIATIEAMADKMGAMQKRGQNFHEDNYKELLQKQADRQKKSNAIIKQHQDEIAANYQKLVTNQEKKMGERQKELDEAHKQDMAHLKAKVAAYESYMANVEKANDAQRAKNYKKAQATQRQIEDRAKLSLKRHQAQFKALVAKQNERDKKRSLLAKLFHKKIQNNQKASDDLEKSIADKNKALEKHQRIKNVDGIQYVIQRQDAMYAALNKQEVQNQKDAMKMVEMRANQIAKRSLESKQFHENIAKKMNEEDQNYQLYNQNLAAQQMEHIKNYKFNKYKGDKATPNKSALAKKYPVGVTEETEKLPNATVLKRIMVNSDGSAHIYKKIYYQWGAVGYKKDGYFTTEDVWKQSSNK